jgi:hypothetical protein
MCSTGWTLHVKASSDAFDAIGTIGADLSILQNPRQGISIMLSGMRIRDNPGIFRLTDLLLIIRRRQVAFTKCPSNDIFAPFLVR